MVDAHLDDHKGGQQDHRHGQEDQGVAGGPPVEGRFGGAVDQGKQPAGHRPRSGDVPMGFAFGPAFMQDT